MRWRCVGWAMGGKSRNSHFGAPELAEVRRKLRPANSTDSSEPARTATLGANAIAIARSEERILGLFRRPLHLRRTGIGHLSRLLSVSSYHNANRFSNQLVAAKAEADQRFGEARDVDSDDAVIVRSSTSHTFTIS